VSPACEDAPEHGGATAIYDTDCSSRRRFDLEAHDRVVAVRDLLDAFAIGRIRPTELALENLGGVLVAAGMHQAAADRERAAA
jgi:hypothetical protein